MDEQVLRSVSLFASLDRDDLRRVAQVSDQIEVAEGKQLLGEGQFAYEFMVILEGHARVTRDGQELADLGPGDFLGEIAALDNGKRTASVTATSPMSVLVMTARDLRQLASAIPQLRERVQKAAAERNPLGQTS